MIPVKNPTIPSITALHTFFTFSHKPIQKFLNHSHLFHNRTNPAISAAIAATINTIGFASNVALKAANAVLTVFIIATNLGTIVIIVPTDDMSFANMIRNGPSADTMANTTNTTFCAAGFKLVNQFVNFDIADIILFKIGNKISPNLTQSSVTVFFI